MNEVKHTGGDRFFLPRIKMLGRIALFFSLTVACVYAASVPAGRRWVGEQLPGGWPVNHTPTGSAAVVALLLCVAAVSVVLACYFLKQAVVDKPILVVNNRGLRHNIPPGGPHDFRWADVKRVKVERRIHHGFHTSYHIALDLKSPGRKSPSRCEETDFDIADVDESRQDIPGSIRSHAPPEVPVDIVRRA